MTSSRQEFAMAHIPVSPFSCASECSFQRLTPAVQDSTYAPSAPSTAYACCPYDFGAAEHPTAQYVQHQVEREAIEHRFEQSGRVRRSRRR